MITYITGGERSGKSNYAQTLALTLSSQPVYIATARVWDSDFENRIKQHQLNRQEQWTTLEKEKFLSDIDLENKTAVIDCITLWLANFFADSQYDAGLTMQEAKNELEKLLKKPHQYLIIISNEIGMGVHAQTETGRKFVEIQGWINQFLAAKADKVILMISGIPVTLKG